MFRERDCKPWTVELNFRFLEESHISLLLNCVLIFRVYFAVEPDPFHFKEALNLFS